jgi:chromosome segregation protein
VFIEEAAGISKYKERRRETESRMRRTLENLERLNDLRDELGRQLQHLQRQAQAAERYKELKREERGLRQRLLAAQWRDLRDRESEAATVVGDHEVRLEAVYAEQQAVDTRIEEHRVTHSERTDTLGAVQASYYAVGAEVSRIEQEIRYQGERAEQLNSDLASTRAGLEQAQHHLAEDGERLEGWEKELATLAPELEALRGASDSAGAALAAAEAKMQSWQADWDEFNQRAAAPRQEAEVQQSRIQHLEHSLGRLRRRLEELEQEREAQGDADALERLEALRRAHRDSETEAGEASSEAGRLESEVSRRRDERREQQEALNEVRSRLQTRRGRQASLEALQQAARDRAEGKGVGDWLAQQGLAEAPRVLDGLVVDPRWQRAVEVVLGSALQGVCMPRIDSHVDALAALSSGELTLLEGMGVPAESTPGSLAAQLGSTELSSAVAPLLDCVQCVDSASDAMARRRGLAPGESLVTPEGLWFGRNWVRSLHGEESEEGALARQRELEDLQIEVAGLGNDERVCASALAQTEEALVAAEESLRACRRRLEEIGRRRAEALSKLRAEEAKQEQVLARRQRLEKEQNELRSQFEQEQAAIGEARGKLAAAIETMEGDTADREARLAQRDALRSALDAARADAHRSRDAAHQAALRHQSLVTQSETIRNALARSRDQVTTLTGRLSELETAREQNDNPLADLRTALEARLAERLAAEAELTAARQALADIEHTLREAEKERVQIEGRAAELREQLEGRRLTLQGLRHEQRTVADQLDEAGGNLEALLEELPGEVDMAALRGELERCANRIARLGAINLAAVDEYRQQSERKQYLDAQNEDLESALATLESAIRKIDRETRSRFKETFDLVNGGLQELFPRVFGGGSASLEMTGEDLLDTGVSILARPPGKKNSTIHLLSGGEKALTAIALVFSIFQLNPAPFCMLDEVDAPLDDANVGRYARMVREMSEKVQFVFITHNKITMEMADHLMGVTMHEPGVSRLVSVDVEEAAELAAS